MYHAHFGLREAPFRITPQTSYFFAGAQRGALLDALAFAIEHDEGILLVTGEVGVGKTMLCRMLLDRLSAGVRTIYLANPSLGPQELLATLAHELGVNASDGPSLLRRIEEHLIQLYAEGGRAVVIVDEAHAMPRESLEQVRLLSNLESPQRKLLQIALFGQPELNELLAEHALRSLRERITQRFSLDRLKHDEVADYLQFRLHAAGYRGPNLFPPRVLRPLCRAADGLTRRVNILADKTLLAAFADNTRKLLPRHVHRAIRDAGYPVATRGMWPGYAWAGLALTVAAALAGAGWWWLGQTPARPTAPPTAAPEQSAPITPSAAPTEVPASAPAAADVGRLGERAARRLSASRERALATPPGHWFIQLQTVSPPDAIALQDYLGRAEQALEPAQLHVYETRLAQGSRVGIYYGSFADATAAQAALAALPDWMRQAGAYLRRYSALQP